MTTTTTHGTPVLLSQDDLTILSAYSSFNDLGIIYLNEGDTHVMKQRQNMIRVTTHEPIPHEFGTSFRKLEALTKTLAPNQNLEIIDVENGTQYLHATGRYGGSVQIPTEQRKYLEDYLPKTETSFDEFKNRVQEPNHLICEINASDDVPSLFERFNSNMYDPLQIANNDISLYQDKNGNIVIDISQQSVNEGSLPTGAKSKSAGLQKNDHFVRSIVCSADDLIGSFPKGYVFTIPTKIYEIMQRTKRQFNMKLGHFEMADQTWLGMYSYSDNIEYFNILQGTNDK